MQPVNYTLPLLVIMQPVNYTLPLLVIMQPVNYTLPLLVIMQPVNAAVRVLFDIALGISVRLAQFCVCSDRVNVLFISYIVSN